jgi:uncharacterized membrane protein
VGSLPAIAEAIEAGIGAIALALEAAAAIVILVAAAHALLAFARGTARGRGMSDDDRHRFARSLLVALDLAVGSDILKVALRPAWEGVLVAASVALVRALLTLVVEHELRGRRGAAHDA